MSITESHIEEPFSPVASSQEQRVRELAYQIWETEGRPVGHAGRHWELANKLAEVEARDEPRPAKRTRNLQKPHDAADDIAQPAGTRKSQAPKTGTAKKPT